MAATDFLVAGNLGLLVALSLVVFELCLLPFFELTRDSLTIAVARRRIAAGFPLTIGPEWLLPSAFGLSDGITRPSAFAAPPRLLKATFKIALILSLTIWESQLESVQRATSVVVRFAAGEGSSSVMAPIPVEGLRTGAVRALVPYGEEAARAERNYLVKSTSGISIKYSAHCVRTDGNGKNKTRTVFFGIYTSSVAGRGDLVCLNGTNGRERAPIFTYNPDGEHTVHANVTSVRLRRLVAHDNMSALYAADAFVGGEGPLTGNHSGFVSVTSRTHLSKDVRWSMYGLLLHRERGTVLRISFPLTTTTDDFLCGAPTAEMGGAVRDNGFGPSWRGVWKRRDGNMTCPDGHHFDYRTRDSGPLQHLSDVQDVGLRLATSEIFKIGPTLDVLRAWLAEIPWYMFRSKKLFTIDLREMIDTDILFFSTAKAQSLTLHVGRERNHVQMASWSTALLLAVIGAFLLYCITSCILEVVSRTTTGIASECFTRDAVLSFLRDEAVMHSKITQNASARLTIGLTNVGLHKQRIGLVSKGQCAMRDKERLMSNEYLDHVEPG